MDIKRSGSQPSASGPANYFTGTVRVDSSIEGSGSLNDATVTFEPGARTAWHTRPLGQTLLVTSGLGRVQREGALRRDPPGDIVWFKPGEKHWHGAAPGCATSHIAIAEMKDGHAVDWMEKVSDAHYDGRARLAGLAAPLFLFVSAMGFIVANSIAGAMADYPKARVPCRPSSARSSTEAGS